MVCIAEPGAHQQRAFSDLEPRRPVRRFFLPRSRDDVTQTTVAASPASRARAPIGSAQQG
jgi:hypothetical protein